jgi:hypothetical protein
MPEPLELDAMWEPDDSLVERIALALAYGDQDDGTWGPDCAPTTREIYRCDATNALIAAVESGALVPRAQVEELRTAAWRVAGHTELEPFDPDRAHEYRWVSNEWINALRSALASFAREGERG